VSAPQIMACGGALLGADPSLCHHVLGLTGRERPRVCLLPTASGDRDDVTLNFYEQLGARGDLSHVALFKRTIEDVHAHLLAQDLILVSGGNTASMLAVWRLHGIDVALREAWESGIILAGTSAGALCWFEDGVTDSFGPLGALADGLGFLPGSFCPHYATEPERRPTYTRLVQDGSMAPGYAADDLAALCFRGTELVDVIAGRPGVRVLRVDAEGEHPLDVRVLSA
jgi:dipeptidase E